MSRLRSLLPPPADAGRDETLDWVRRMELLGAAACVVVAVVDWRQPVWRWVLLGMAASGVSPWPGARAIQRRARRRGVAVPADPGRRARRGALVMTAIYLVAGGVIGYLEDGWAASIVLAALLGVSGATGTWWVWRRYPPRARS